MVGPAVGMGLVGSSVAPGRLDRFGVIEEAGPVVPVGFSWLEDSF